jgi:hypothetical protein
VRALIIEELYNIKAAEFERHKLCATRFRNSTHIATQEIHHRVASFQEEFRKLLDAHGIAYDERYVSD